MSIRYWPTTKAMGEDDWLKTLPRLMNMTQRVTISAFKEEVVRY